MSRSVASRASNASSLMMEQLAQRSQTKIFKAQGSFNDQQMRVIWNGLGLYINRNLRMGRGINIPKFGTFTFTPPEFRLTGVTNQIQRDKKPRTPVFLIQKNFVKGMNFKTAIFYHQEFGLGLRPYAVFGSNGDVPITKLNIVQISSYANMSKDATQTALNRIFKYLGQKISQGINLNFQIPSVGALVSKGNLVAVKFNDQLHRQTRTILSKSVDQRKQRGIMNLTSQNLKKLNNFSEMSSKLQTKPSEFFQIDQKAQKYLNQTFGFHVDQSNMRRTITGFDRSFASRPFDTTNTFLKTSHFNRMSMTGFSRDKSKNFNRQYNLALRLVKQWVYKNSLSTQKSFKDFCRLAGTSKQVLVQDEVWAACKKISLDITEQQSQELFRLLDFNKDGYVTEDDWKKNINFDNNKILKELINNIKGKKYTISNVLKIMNLEGVKTVNVYSLRDALKKLSPSLSDQTALLLSRYICKGKPQVGIQSIVDILNITSLQQEKIKIDKEWQEKFIGRIKGNLSNRQIYEQQLLNKFRFYDNKRSGYIDQAQFKNVLGQIGINITLSELVKIVKIFTINTSNQINYEEFVNKLNLTEASQNQSQLSYRQFNKILLQSLSKQNKFTFKLPISVIQFTSLLQLKIFKDYSEKNLLPLVKNIDINKDGFISEQDLKCFKTKNEMKQIPPLGQLQICQLFKKLREKSIRKKISFFDVFRQIDTNSNGFITRQQWSKNLDKIISFNETQKQNMFNFMNKGKQLGMIDYKTFLMFVNSQNSVPQVNGYEKFDWVQNVLQKIQAWYLSSKLTLEDSFRVIDKDADTYLSQKDIIAFLTDRLKISSHQANLVRIQKLIKVLDTFKRGKLNFLDWRHFIQKDNKKNWIQDAKQQIGLVISRKYNDLEEAYTAITQGDRKLLFNAFEKWIKSNKVLSGFMINEDILKNLYSALDTHKKGYLLQNDFISAFSSFKWKVQHVKQFIQELKTKFKSCSDAFKCMISYKNTELLSQSQFYESSKIMFGNRFTKTDLKQIWNTIAFGKKELKYNEFQSNYGSQWTNKNNVIEKTFPKDSWQYKDFNIIKGTTVRSSQFGYTEADNISTQTLNIIQNVKELLAASPKTLQQAFQEVDTSKNGKVTNLQFKKAFRTLNIALTAKQIDLLLNYCNFKLDTLIDWRDFIKKLDLKQQKKIIFERLKQRIQHLSDLLHYYMVSPKDAFRKCNNQRTGYMSFEEFYKMIKKVYEQASEALPQFEVIKQLFTYIDVRKDEQIDFQQFTQIFRNCKPPSLLMGTKPVDEQQNITKALKHTDQKKPIRQQSVTLFKNSPVYEELINLLGRNRKYILTQIQKSSKESLVPFDIVEKIIRQFAEKQNLKIEENIIRNLLAFSMTGQKVDYHLMLNNFKQRSEMVVGYPKKNFF